MKVGDLVKIKWITFAMKRRAQKVGFPPVDAPGLVVDKLGTIVKVMYPQRPGKTLNFVEKDLEVENEGR